MAEQPDLTEHARLVRIWAENRVDKETRHALPPNQREARIKQIISQRHAERAAKPAEFELDPDAQP